MENTVIKKKSFFQNSFRVIVSIFVAYEACVLCLGAFTFWGLNRREENISVNSTSIAISHATERSQFELIDYFDDNSHKWHVGQFKDNGRWEGSTEIKDGVYAFKVKKVFTPFLESTDFFNAFPIKDFDVYLDTKFNDEISGHVCSGLVFRRSFKGWRYGAYVFSICNDATFTTMYYNENGWENISGQRFSKAILPSDWNRIEITARGDHFNFSINDVAVYELTDNRQEEGALEIMIEVNNENPTVIWFDNFGYQPR